MAVNVNAARDQANQITNQIAGLKRAKTQLTDYKSSLAANWSGAEVRYVSKGIDQVVRQIDDVINRLTSLSNAIKSAAAAVKREEDAAARAKAQAAARAKAQRIAKAKSDFEKAEAEYKKKKKELERLTKNDDDAPGEFDALLRVSKIFENFERIQKLNEELERAKTLWRANAVYGIMRGDKTADIRFKGVSADGNNKNKCSGCSQCRQSGEKGKENSYDCKSKHPVYKK